MASSVMPLEALGERVASGLDAHSREREEAIEVARRAYLSVALSRPRSTRRGHTIWLVAAALAGVFVVALWLSRPRALSFTADGEVAAAQTWLSAPRSRPLVLRFSEGTVLHAEPSSRVRVIDVGEQGASVALENGLLRADVVHTGTSAWKVIAGPLTVRVTGTRFDLHWSVVSEEFLIFVREGSVEVSGAVVGAERPVRAGETLRVSVAGQRLELTKGPPSLQDTAAAAPALSVEPQAAEDGPKVASPSAEPGLRSGSTTAKEPDWRELAKSGSLRKAFLAAEASGFDAVCSTATASELLLLGDAARLAGRADRSSEALLALRQRYPTDSRRAAAAFALGKVAFDNNRAYAQAAEWFATSIREQPGGSLSREAAGRLIEAQRKAGNVAAARRAATDYLARYPEGPHADVARSLLR